MSKHTPGPWKVYANLGDHNTLKVMADDGMDVVAVVHNHSLIEGEPEPDANLIAAAPEMLTQLKSLVSAWDFAKTGEARFEIDDESVDIVRRLIDKAEGKS